MCNTPEADPPADSPLALACLRFGRRGTRRAVTPDSALRANTASPYPDTFPRRIPANSPVPVPTPCVRRADDLAQTSRRHGPDRLVTDSQAWVSDSSVVRASGLEALTA
jgi:hypothetical protein